MEKSDKTFDNVKKEIRSLLISSPVGLRLQDLLSDYRAMIGKQLPFKDFGYSSALEMVKHMPDVVCPVFRPGGTMFLEAVPDKSTMHIKRLVLRQKSNGRISSIRRPKDESVCQPPVKPIIPATVRMKIKQMMRSHPDGLETSRFGVMYIKRFGCGIKFQEYGYLTLNRLLADCDDIVDMVATEKDGRKSTILFLKGNAHKSLTTQPSGATSPKRKSSSSQSLECSSTSTPQWAASQRRLPAGTDTEGKPSGVHKPSALNVLDLEPEDEYSPAPNEGGDNMIFVQTGVSDQLKSEIKSLLEIKQNGVWLARFPFEYKKQFNKALDFKASGYLSLIALMGSLSDVVRIDRPVENGDWLLHGAASVDKPGLEDPIPSDAVKYDGIIQKMLHPVEGQMEIFIVQIENPSDFCFHWIKKKEALDDLMNQMSDFYKSISSQSYILPISHRKHGQVCAAVYDADGDWYRALISRVISESEVEVVYADYGNKAVVNPFSLRFLKKEFIDLPAMCIKGSLAKIKPLQSTWSSQSAIRFFELTKDKALLGKIHRVQDNIVSLDIVDTTNYNSAVHVNDMLVVEKLAAYSNPLPQVPSSLYSANISNYVRQPPMLPFQNPYFHATMQMGMNTYLQHAALMGPSQLPYLGSYMYPPFQQAHAMFPPRQPSLNPVLHRSASVPTTPHPRGVEVQHKQIFSDTESMDSFINKINSELDDKSSFEDSASDVESCSDEEQAAQQSSNIRRLLCEQYKLHIIKCDGRPYVTRREISSLFWYKDILRQMLLQKKVVIQSLVISREDYSDLFNELRREGVKDFIESDEIKESLTLYPLQSLPLILNTFKHQSKELRRIIDEEVATFKNFPEQYMEAKGELPTENEEDIEEDSMTLELELEELRLLLQAMQFRRKRLMNSLVSKTASADKVNETKRVEEEIETIRKKIQMKGGSSM